MTFVISRLAHRLSQEKARDNERTIIRRHLRGVGIAKHLEHGLIRHEEQPHPLGAAFLDAVGIGAEHAVPRLPRLVPPVDGPSGHRVDGRVVDVEVEHADGVLAQQPPGAVAEELVAGRHDAEALLAVLSEEVQLLVPDVRDRLVSRVRGVDVSELEVLGSGGAEDVLELCVR